MPAALLAACAQSPRDARRARARARRPEWSIQRGERSQGREPVPDEPGGGGHRRHAAPHAIIVNETLVRQAFLDRDPIGQRLVTGMLQLEGEIVGVVSDTRSVDLATPPAAEMFYPLLQRPESFSNVLGREAAIPWRSSPPSAPL